MRNNEQKIIRGIELNSKYKNNELDYIEDLEYKRKRFISDSELLRIVEALDSKNIEIVEDKGVKRKYISGIISVKVNHNLDKYSYIKESDDILILNHKKFVKSKTDDKKYTVETVYEDDAKTKPKREYFKRVMVGPGHNRSKKALFVREDLFDKVDIILNGGISDYSEINGYPNYSKGYAKWNSYYALPSTDSKAVKRIPNIVVINDYKRTVSDTFDMVYQYKDINPDWKNGNDLKNKYTKTYDVKRGIFRDDVEILPFDGAGLVSVECASEWVDDLHIINGKGKRYIPAAFQFRAIPGFKGNVYTFDIEAFGREHGYIIIDIKGKHHDIRKEKIDLILTKSQAKFIELFDNDVEKWKAIFNKPVVFYKKDAAGNNTDKIECQYRRTFNISDYSEDVCDLSNTMYSAYQHLQTVCFTDNEIETYTKRTVDMIRESSTSMEGFLKYRGCTESEKKNNPRDWNAMPPYYRAAYYLLQRDKNLANILYADKYFRSKVKVDIDGMINRAKSGKEKIDGNYQVLTPDLYGLAQYAFGERDDSKIGLLKAEEVYSNWWMNWRSEEGEICPPDTLALIRNPHIFMEARTVKLLHDGVGFENEPLKDALKRMDEIKRWYKYQTTGIVTDSFSTIPLALGTADFDGDHIASTNSTEYINAVNRARSEGNGNTVDYKIIKSKLVQIEDRVKEKIDVSDIKKLMEFDIIAYMNNIGKVIDRVTELWGIEQTDDNRDTIMKYIAIADIIGQLTIDAAKTGEFEEFYSEILCYLKQAGVMEPYFKKYLPKKKKKRKQEEKGISNAEKFYGDNVEILKNQKKFSDFNTNMNRICHHMEREISCIDTQIDSVEFNLNEFLRIFLTDMVNEKSELYQRVRKKLIAVSKKHNQIVLQNKENDNEYDSESKEGNYRYFYSHARNQLLSQCKLTEDKSINKILNIIVYLCYCDEELCINDNAKAIMWNSFDEEMIKRSRNIKDEPGYNWDKLEERLKKTEELYNKKYAKQIEKINKKEWDFEALSEKKVNNPIIITQSDKKYIQGNIKPSTEINNKKIGNKRALLLRRLFIVLMAISKRSEKDVSRKTKNRNEIKIYHYVKEIEICYGSNKKLNFSALAKMAEFSDYERKHIDTMLSDLKEIGMIKISDKKMDKLKIKVNYEPDNKSFDSSLVDPYSYDYKKICSKLIRLFK